MGGIIGSVPSAAPSPPPRASTNYRIAPSPLPTSSKLDPALAALMKPENAKMLVEVQVLLRDASAPTLKQLPDAGLVVLKPAGANHRAHGADCGGPAWRPHSGRRSPLRRQGGGRRSMRRSIGPGSPIIQVMRPAILFLFAATACAQTFSSHSGWSFADTLQTATDVVVGDIVSGIRGRRRLKGQRDGHSAGRARACRQRGGRHKPGAAMAVSPDADTEPGCYLHSPKSQGDCGFFAAARENCSRSRQPP